MESDSERSFIRLNPDNLLDDAIDDYAERLLRTLSAQLQGGHMPITLSQRYADAVAYASEAHATQTRKGTSKPYITHLLATSSLVLEASGDEDLAIAGLLHDVAEDQGGQRRLDDVRARFGDRVADIVKGCSDSLSEDPDEKQPYIERKTKHIEHLREASDDVLIVTAADKLHNARAIHTDLVLYGPETLARFNGSAEQILWYYRSVVDVLVGRDAAAELVKMLRLAVAGIEREFAKLPQYELAHGSAGDWLRLQQDSLLPDDNVIMIHSYEDWRAELLSGSRRLASGPLLWSIQACDSVPRYPHEYSYWAWTRGDHWQILIVDKRTDSIAAMFHSDGSWTEADGRMSTWSSVIEGGPDAVIRSILPRPRRGRW